MVEQAEDVLAVRREAVASLGLVAVATYLAYLARFDGDIPTREASVLLWGIPFVLVAFAFPYLYLGIYRSIWRYAGVEDFWQMAKALVMPTRLEAIGEIIGMILGPASAIAGCLTGPGAQVASQIATIADKKEEAPAAPAA